VAHVGDSPALNQLRTIGFEMTRAGLLGFGLAGRFFHTPLLLAAGIRIDAVVTRQQDIVKANLPQARIIEDADELFEDPHIDLVVIATPNDLHAPQALAALRAGKHVAIDKPMCITAAEADELIALAHRERRMLTVFQNRRWDADFLTIQELVRTGRLGELNAFHARWDRFRPTVVDRWREHGPGGGVLYDLGAHLIDQVLCLFGMPDWVQADVFAQRSGARADDGFELLLGAGNARITLGASTLVTDGGPRYRVHGSMGSYVKSGLDVQEAQLRSGMSPQDPRFGVEPELQWGTFTEGASGAAERVRSMPGAWTTFYAAVRAAIETGAAPPVPASQARDVIRVIEAAIESSRSGKRVALR
jgi:scyllo-inositol 2-dehydrogenase (NADP+)